MQAKESETSPTPISRGPHKNTKLQNHNTYAEDLAQTQMGSLIVASVSVRPHEASLLGSVVCVLMMSLTTLVPTTLSPHLLQGFPGSA